MKISKRMLRVGGMMFGLLFLLTIGFQTEFRTGPSPSEGTLNLGIQHLEKSIGIGLGPEVAIADTGGGDPGGGGGPFGNCGTFYGGMPYEAHYMMLCYSSQIGYYWCSGCTYNPYSYCYFPEFCAL